MIKIAKAVVRAVRNELASGESGWVSLNSAGAFPVTGKTATSGKVVNAEAAMTVSAVWGCVTSTAQIVGTLPGAMYERQADGSKKEIDTELAQILSTSPNATQTGVEFWEGNTAHMVLRGNSYNEKLFVGNRLVGLRPLLGAKPVRSRAGGFDYVYFDRGKKITLPAEKVFHLRGFGAGDGLGMSAIQFGANSIGSALSADETAGKVFANGMMASGILTSEQTLNADQRAQLQTIIDTYTGSTRAGKIMTLEGGLGYSQLQMNPDDAQLLDTRKFSVEDVCRWFSTPPIIIGHASEGQTMWGSGVEAIMLSWLKRGINPLLCKIEARIGKDLIPPAKRNKWFYRFNREAMLQMDSQAKGDFLLKMRMGGFMSGDEGRDKLNLPRRGGNNDELLVQTSLDMVDLLGKDKK